MAGKRLSMRRTREILRQKWALGRSHREVARSLGVSTGAISAVLARAKSVGLSWEAVEGLSELELERGLYGSAAGGSSARPMPEWAEIHTELGRKGVTLALLHLEYLEHHPGGYGYTQFCSYYKRWRGQQKRSMRQAFDSSGGGRVGPVDRAGPASREDTSTSSSGSLRTIPSGAKTRSLKSSSRSLASPIRAAPSGATWPRAPHRREVVRPGGRL